MKFLPSAVSFLALFAASASADGDDCNGTQETIRTELDFKNSELTVNTLHLPDGQLRYKDVGVHENDQPLDIIITVTSGSYTDIAQTWADRTAADVGGKNRVWDEQKNGQVEVDGEFSAFASINLQTLPGKPESGRGNFRLCIVDQATSDTVELERFSWTVYDTDERGADSNSKESLKEKLIMDMAQVASFKLDPQTEIELRCEEEDAILGADQRCNDGRTVFHSSTAGVGKDNPTDPDNLTDEQLARSILFNFEYTSCFDFTYDHYCPTEQNGGTKQCKGYTGGNFLMAGNSDSLMKDGECITNSPTLAPTDTPTVATPSPTVATDAPTVATDAPTVSTDAPTVSTDAPTIATDAPITVVRTEPPVARTESPTAATDSPTAATGSPTVSPTVATDAPVMATGSPTTASPTSTPTVATGSPTAATASPTAATDSPTAATGSPTVSPTVATDSPTMASGHPTNVATGSPTAATASPTAATDSPTAATGSPTVSPTVATDAPTMASGHPTTEATASPTAATASPTAATASPTVSPSVATDAPVMATGSPTTASPTGTPTVATGSPTASTASPATATDSPNAATDSPTVSPTVATDAPAMATGSPTAATGRPTATTTDAPTDKETSVQNQTGDPTGQPSLPPAPCPEDVELLKIVGTTDIDLQQAVQVISQDTSSVTVRLYNAWTSSSDVVQSIFYQYKNDYNNKCYEVQDVAGGATYEDVTIQCLVSVPYAELEIWIEDGTGNVLDADGDNAEVPKCCKPPDGLTTPAVKYTLVVMCETLCVEAFERRGLRGSAV